jgi:hypothetical protein
LYLTRQDQICFDFGGLNQNMFVSLSHLYSPQMRAIKAWAKIRDKDTKNNNQIGVKVEKKR